MDRQGPLMDHHHIGLTDICRTAGLSTLFDTVVVFESFPMEREGLSDTEANGGILLIHGRQASVAALPAWLDQIAALGLKPATLGEVLR